MTLTSFFQCSKDEFYVKLISAAQGFQIKSGISATLILTVVEEKHEFGLVKMTITNKAFGDLAGEAQCAYYEENGGVKCTTTINLTLSYKLGFWPRKIRRGFEDMFQQIK